MRKQWIVIENDTHYKEYRQIGNVFYFIEITDMEDATGRDNIGHPCFVCELNIVNLDEISPKALQDAIRSSGWDEMPQTAPAYAECLFSYGNRAFVESWSSVSVTTENNMYGNATGRTAIHREARREAKRLIEDADALETAMERPCNQIGSTAREMMRGDIMAGLTRGIESGKPEARLMGKLYGVPEKVMDDARPADFLPYLMGYLHAIAGNEAETDPDTSPEYFRGHDRGIETREGRLPAPSWIQSQKRLF